MLIPTPSHKGVTVHDTSSFMPPQAPPINRSPSGAAAFGSQSGVDASSVWRLPGTVPNWLDAMKGRGLRSS